VIQALVTEATARGHSVTSTNATVGSCGRMEYELSNRFAVHKKGFSPYGPSWLVGG